MNFGTVQFLVYSTLIFTSVSGLSVCADAEVSFLQRCCVVQTSPAHAFTYSEIISLIILHASIYLQIPYHY